MVTRRKHVTPSTDGVAGRTDMSDESHARTPGTLDAVGGRFQSLTEAEPLVPVARESRTTRLTAEQETTLARAWRNDGDESARSRLITANLGLVVAIAQRYRGGGVPLDELIAEGNLGLVHAVDGFDPECGSRFSTYAAYWIRQGISRAFAANSPRGRLSVRDRRDLAACERAARRHYANTGQLPTDAELAKSLGWATERVAACREMFVSYSRPCSLDQPRPSGMDHAAKKPEPAPETSAPDAGRKVSRLLADLSDFERSALELRFGLHQGEPQTIDAIAEALGRTRREIRAALHGAMAKLSRTARGRRARPSSDAQPGRNRLSSHLALV